MVVFSVAAADLRVRAALCPLAERFLVLRSSPLSGCASAVPCTGAAGEATNSVGDICALSEMAARSLFLSRRLRVLVLLGLLLCCLVDEAGCSSEASCTAFLRLFSSFSGLWNSGDGGGRFMEYMKALKLALNPMKKIA